MSAGDHTHPSMPTERHHQTAHASGQHGTVCGGLLSAPTVAAMHTLPMPSVVLKDAPHVLLVAEPLPSSFPSDAGRSTSALI